MLAAHDAAEIAGEVGGFCRDRNHLFAVGGIVDVDQGANVQDADAGMGPVTGDGVVCGDDFAEALDEFAEAINRNGVVFDEGDGFAGARDAVEERFACFAEFPGIEHCAGVFVDIHRDCDGVTARGIGFESGDDFAEGGDSIVDFFARCTEVFDVEHGFQRLPVGRRGHEFDVLAILGIGFCEVDDDVVEHLDGAGLRGENRDDGGDGFVEVSKSKDCEGFRFGFVVEFQCCAERECECAFAAAEEWGEVDVFVCDASVELTQDHVEAIACVATNGFGESLSDE